MSIKSITYLDQFITSEITSISDSSLEVLYFYDRLEIKRFLEDLKEDKVYVATLEFVPS
jgi:hypothetical protein